MTQGSGPDPQNAAGRPGVPDHGWAGCRRPACHDPRRRRRLLRPAGGDLGPAIGAATGAPSPRAFATCRPRVSAASRRRGKTRSAAGWSSAWQRCSLTPSCWESLCGASDGSCGVCPAEARSPLPSRLPARDVCAGLWVRDTPRVPHRRQPAVYPCATVHIELSMPEAEIWGRAHSLPHAGRRLPRLLARTCT